MNKPHPPHISPFLDPAARSRAVSAAGKNGCGCAQYTWAHFMVPVNRNGVWHHPSCQKGR